METGLITCPFSLLSGFDNTEMHTQRDTLYSCLLGKDNMQLWWDLYFVGPSTSLWGLYSYTCSQVSVFQTSVEHSFAIFIVLLTQPGIFSGSRKAWEHLLHRAFMLWSASGLRQNAPRLGLYRGLSGDRWTVDSSTWWHMPMILAVRYQGEGTGAAKPWIPIPPGLHNEFQVSLCDIVAQLF